MSLSYDLYLLLTDYLDHKTRRALAEISPLFHTINQTWCTRRAQYLRQACPMLCYLSVTQLSTILATPVLGISCHTDAPEEREVIGTLFDHYRGIIGDNTQNRAALQELITQMAKEHSLRRIPDCRPLFVTTYGKLITNYNKRLVTIDEDLNLYVDAELYVSDIADLYLRSGSCEISVRTRNGDGYAFFSSSPNRADKQEAIKCMSGYYYIYDDYYLSKSSKARIKISDYPVVFLCWKYLTFLFTCQDRETRTSYIIHVYERVITFRVPIPTVRLAVGLHDPQSEDEDANFFERYLVLLDDGACAIIGQNLFDRTDTVIHIQAETYDHIMYCDQNIVARRGEEMYHLSVEGNVVISSPRKEWCHAVINNSEYKLMC